MHEILLLAFLVISLLILISSIDDLLVDAWLAFNNVRPLALDEGRNNQKGTESATLRVAIFVANWHEEDVLERMITINLSQIQDPNVFFYLGVYPNDHVTKIIAEDLARRYPSRVFVVVNRLAGPTSKGQMLNEMFAKCFSEERHSRDLVVLHDSEDIIDPRSFDLYRRYSNDADFIQIPVFAFDSRSRSLVAATYMEEFAERHTREMLLRDDIQAIIPSAGVGTCISKRLIETLLEHNGGVLKPGTVTEDYLLGAETIKLGFRSKFVAEVDRRSDPSWIATREYFPKTFSTSVKQKTRWVYGICFEGWRHLGFEGSWKQKYFLFRDRKGLVANFLPMIALGLMVPLVINGIFGEGYSGGESKFLAVVVTLNTLAIVARYVTRLNALYDVYRHADPLGVILRWPVAILVNAAATFKAWQLFLFKSEFATKPVAWAKTTHELPPLFAESTLPQVCAFEGHNIGGAIVDPSLKISSTAVITGHYATDQSIGSPAASAGSPGNVTSLETYQRQRLLRSNIERIEFHPDGDRKEDEYEQK